MPTSLFKYQPFSAITLANLKQRTLWFSAPHRFNDPFDCGLVPNTAEITQVHLERLAKYIEQRTGQSGLPGVRLQDGTLDPRLKDNLLSAAKTAFKQQSARITHERGVACFASSPADLLMWSHYADGHRGFCLEFDGSAVPFKDAKPMHYSENLPTLDPMDLLDNDSSESNDELIKALILTKAACWSYEREWRLMHIEADKAYTYPWQALKAVHCGCSMSETNIEIIALVMHGAPTTLCHMRRSDTAFSVESAAFTNTPFTYSQ